jgi:hypothetical protein
MSNTNPISDLLEHHRALLDEAQSDIDAANAEHRETMARVQQMADAANGKHQAALSDAVTRRMKAEGAIAALEELNNGQRQS